MEFPLARQRFYQEVHKPDSEIDLARAALYIAQEECHDLDVDYAIATLDQIADKVRSQLPAEFYPLKIIRLLNTVLFEDLGFAGNTNDYYNPRNSFLHEVLERRQGIPLSLSVVYLEVAKRIGFPMAGVGMPGHFLVRPILADMGIFVDPFNQGEIMFPEDCQDLLQRIYGESARLHPEHLAIITSRRVLARMLANLKAIYLHHQDIPRSLSAIDRILLLFPKAVQELRDRGLIYYQLGRLSESRRDLELYLFEKPDAADAFEIQQVLKQIDRVMNP